MDDIAALLHSHIDSGDLPGAVALTYRGDTVETVAAGVQDLDSGVPMSGDTLFLWDSLTKPLTAALALTFVADGSLALDSPVERWLPELSSPRVLVDPSGSLARIVPAERPVRVEDLLTLRGGLGFTTDFGSPFTEALVSGLEEGPRPRSLGREEFLARAAELPLAHQPGDGWTYNTGSTILGLLLERVAGRGLEALMAERLCAPLGMRDARWWVPEADRPRFASRYARTGDPASPLALIDGPDGDYSRPRPFPDGAGGMIGTAGDWLAFGRMLLGGGVAEGRTILPRTLVEAMMTDQLTAEQRSSAGNFLGDGEGWGYGGSVRPDGTFGWSGGAGTTSRVDPRRGQAWLLFTQVALDGPEGSPVMAAFEEIIARDHP